MTTADPLSGPPAATRRPLPGFRFLLAAVLACAPVAPVLAQQAGLAADSAQGAAATRPALTTDVLDEAAPAPDGTLLFASDVNKIIATQPADSPQAIAANANTAPISGRIKSVLQQALALLGTPYRWGGTSTNGFDCSGLVGYVFKTALGIELPRVSREMATSGMRIDNPAQLSPGDLVFFGSRGRVSHVGIYVGNGQFLHAPRTGRDVTVSSLSDGYWSAKFLQARRIAGI